MIPIKKSRPKPQIVRNHPMAPALGTVRDRPPGRPFVAVSGPSEARTRWCRWLARSAGCLPALPGDTPIAAIRWLSPAPSGTARDVAALAAYDRAGLRTVGIRAGPGGRLAASAIPLAETVCPLVRPRRLRALLLGGGSVTESLTAER